jgi:hypothetical protein
MNLAHGHSVKESHDAVIEIWRMMHPRFQEPLEETMGKKIDYKIPY